MPRATAETSDDEGETVLKKKGFEILIASPHDYERLVAEIYCDGKFVALLSQEGSSGRFDLETPGPNLKEDQITRKVDLMGFKTALDLACKKLKGETK